MKKRLLSLFCILALCLSPLPAVAFAADETYLALGDSISTGYVLSEDKIETPFPYQVAKENGFTLTNLAENGETSTSLKGKLPELSNAIAAADVITLTIGGNDMVNALYAYLGEQYAAEYPDQQLTAEQVQQKLMLGDLSFLLFTMDVIDGFAASPQASAAALSFGQNFTEIVSKIKEVNADATLLVTTQYNPYSYLASVNASLPQAQTVSDAFKTGVAFVNNAISAASKQLGFTVVDVYSVFEAAVAAGTNPYCPSYTFPTTINLDFHPNQTGHDLIAQFITAALGRGLPFIDVAEGAWYADAVRYVYENGLMEGTGTAVFSPDTTMTRAMFLTILARYAGVDTSVGDTWYQAGAAWAVETGVSDGTNLDQPLTREQLATMLWRYAQLKDYNVSVGEETNILSFTDAQDVSEWAMSAVQWACGAGVINGTGDGSTLSPQGSASRAEAATMLMRFVPMLQ